MIQSDEHAPHTIYISIYTVKQLSNRSVVKIEHGQARTKFRMDLAVRSTAYVIKLQSQCLFVSFSLAQLALSRSFNLFLAILRVCGIQFNVFGDRIKIQDLNNHVDVMHQREAKLLAKIQALTEEVEVQSRNKARAINKLNRARSDSEALAASLDKARATSGQDGVSRSSPIRASNSSSMYLSHALLWSAVGSFFYSRSTMGNLEFKLIMSLLIPAVMLFLAPCDAPPATWRLALTQSVASGVLGFLISHSLC